MPRKQQISIERRRALRAWARAQNPRPPQKACIGWFAQKYGMRISQSTVSESLSSHFDILDSAKDTQRARIRTGQWPELEAILFKWQQHSEESGGVTSGELLRQRAQQIWRELPQYMHEPCPEFSTSWLQNFKKRHSIRQYTQHDEASPDLESAEKKMMAPATRAGGLGEENEEEVGQEEISRDLVSQHIGQDSIQDEAKDEMQLDITRPSVGDARKAVQVLIDFLENRDDIETSFLRSLERLERELEVIYLNGYSQGTPDNWLI